MILSTESWGKMLLSKMHFAVELAAKGNSVYFVNPPRAQGSNEPVYTSKLDMFPNITLVHIKPIKHALFLRHKLLFVYIWLMGRYIRNIRKLVEGTIDEVWCFNPHVFVNLTGFRAKKSVLLLYDFYKGAHVFKAAATADAIISPSQLILDHYQNCSAPKLLVQHGLGKHFAAIATEKLKCSNFPLIHGGKIKIGYTGNLLRAGMATGATKKIVEQHPDKEFHFWGPFSANGNNVTDSREFVSKELADFIIFLKECSNVYLHGVKEQRDLANEMGEMDLFLFLYTVTKDINAASNSHKILEYLSTGKTVVSTYVSNYAGTDLLTMCQNEKDLPELFNKVTSRLAEYNSAEKQQQRIAFALNNTYSRQVERIENFINSPGRFTTN